MLTRIPAFAIIPAASLLGAAPALAIDPANLNLITFENRTGQDIRYIFLSPGDSEYWGTDILGSMRVLEDKKDLGFYIHYPDRCNEFDIFAIGQNEAAYLVYGYEICDGEPAKVRITPRNLDADAKEFNFTTVTIENETDYSLWYVFFSPGDSDMWGVDQLDKETILDPGNSLSVLLPVGDEATRYDVHAVDEDKDTYTFYVEIDPEMGEHVYTIVNEDID